MGNNAGRRCCRNLCKYCNSHFLIGLWTNRVNGRSPCSMHTTVIRWQWCEVSERPGSRCMRCRASDFFLLGSRSIATGMNIVTSIKRMVSAVEDFIKFLEKNHIDAIIPTALKGNEFICTYREQLRKFSKAAYNDSTMFELLSDKKKTREFALTLGIRCPLTFARYSTRVTFLLKSFISDSL